MMLMSGLAFLMICRSLLCYNLKEFATWHLLRFFLCFQVLTSIGNFCICSIAIGMVIEIIVIYGVHGRAYRVGIDNLLVLLIGGIPIAMPTVLSVTMAIGSHRLSQQVCRLIFMDCFWIYLTTVYSTALQSCQKVDVFLT